MTTTSDIPTTPGGPTIPPPEDYQAPTKLEAFSSSPAYPATLANPGEKAIIGANGEMIPPNHFKQYAGITTRQLFALHLSARVPMPTDSDKAKKRQKFIAECFAYADEMLAQDAPPNQ